MVPDSRSLSLLLAVLLFGAGCVQTSMLPAHQLGSGETTVAASIDEPGLLWIPRVNVQATHGFGKGDLTVNLGGTANVLGGGLSGRYYLSDRVNGELQVQGAYVVNDWAGTAFFGLQQVPTEDDQWYLGAHVGALNGKEVINSFSRQTSPLVGGSVGIGHIELGTSWRMQIELEANTTIPYSEESSLPPGRLSVGIFRLYR